MLIAIRKYYIPRRNLKIGSPYLVTAGAAALITLHEIHAEVVCLTRDAHAVVDIDLAVGAGVAGQAGAGQLQRGTPLIALFDTAGAVQTGARGAGVVGSLTAESHVPE
jgi:hypothetical protein